MEITFATENEILEFFHDTLEYKIFIHKNCNNITFPQIIYASFCDYTFRSICFVQDLKEFGIQTVITINHFHREMEIKGDRILRIYDVNGATKSLAFTITKRCDV
jgi:hypothetical protein